VFCRSVSARPSVKSVRGSSICPKEIFDELAYSYGEEAFAKLVNKYDDGYVLYRGKGCETCKNTGYKGRTGLHELLIGTDEIERMIQWRSTAEELLKVAREHGTFTSDHSWLARRSLLSFPPLFSLQIVFTRVSATGCLHCLSPRGDLSCR
jgi:hypothetical protein